jgi:hypothetical protein
VGFSIIAVANGRQRGGAKVLVLVRTITLLNGEHTQVSETAGTRQRRTQTEL